MRLVLVGISHHRAPVELRELVALVPAQAAELAAELAEDGEAVCLSTCNRTELYVAGQDGGAAETRALEALVRLSGVPEAKLTPFLYRLSDDEAALHLFRVAAGLDSMVPGEGEILGQVRVAYEAGAAGPLLDRAFRQALHAGRKARSETGIGESAASVSSVAAALAEQVFDDIRGRRVLLIGAGKTGESTARNFVSRGAAVSVVANRTPERAQELADRFGGQPVALRDVARELERADVVVSSTSSRGFVLSREQVEDAVRARRGRPLFLIDIAVPRDLDPAINDLEGCYLYNIDDLQAVVLENLATRMRHAARAEAIVASEAERFRLWRASLEVVPAIASLRARAEQIRAAELAKAEARLGRLSDGERATVESLTAQIVNKLLHLPTVRMKEAAAAPDGVVYADSLRHLFGLGDDRASENRQPR